MGAAVLSAPREFDGTSGRRLFSPYPAYKDSGVEWLGKIPAHWDVRRADAFLAFEKLQIDPSTLNVDEVFHYSIPSVQETGDGQYEPPSEIDSAKLEIVGDRLLVSKLNPRKGVVVIASPKDVPTVCSTELVVLRPIRCELRWAFYLYSGETTRERMSAVVRSATRSHQRAEISDVVKIWHAVPSSTEQRAIAEFLDRKTARIDALLAKKARLIELLQEKRTVLITRAVTKGLDPNVPMKDSGVEWLGEIPAHWEFQAVWTLFALGRGRVISHEEIHENPGPYPVYSSQTENDGVMGYLASYDFIGDYLTWTTDGARAGTVFSRSGKFNCTNVCGTLQARMSGQAELQFIRDALNVATAWFVRHDINPKLMNNVMARIRVQVPPHSEQRAIVAFLDHETERIDVLTAKVRDAIDRLTELRTALISAAVTGKIDVREVAA